MTEPVNRGSIDPIDAEISAVADGGDRGIVVLPTPAEKPAASANGPCPQTDGGDFDPARTQRPFLQCHNFSFFFVVLPQMICLSNMSNLKIEGGHSSSRDACLLLNDRTVI